MFAINKLLLWFRIALRHSTVRSRLFQVSGLVCFMNDLSFAIFIIILLEIIILIAVVVKNTIVLTVDDIDERLEEEEAENL